jgi:phosphatidate cytidylyltransferase
VSAGLTSDQPAATTHWSQGTTRVASGAALVALVIAVVWIAPPALLFAVAEAVLLLAFIEYARLADACGLPIPKIAAGAATMIAMAAVASPHWFADRLAGRGVALDAVMMSAFVAIAALTLTTWRGGRDALGRSAAAVFPVLYLGLPIGALASMPSRGALFLLMLTVMVSDTAQYYSGRAFGRHLLAPSISPKKTIEGAAGGFLFGAATLAIFGAWWLPAVALSLRAALGAAVVALGIAGDLFESMLKRSAGVKDSSTLIPGHGGILDRIDALLFAAPVYYVVLTYV